MSNIIITKQCGKCKIVKPVTEFWKNCNEKVNGYQGHCKICCKAYAQSVRGKAMSRKFWASEKGKLLRQRLSRKWRINHPEKAIAHGAVRNYARNGLILFASECHCWECGQQAQQYHHFLGYDTKHHLDVFPLCRSCHKLLHEQSVISC